MRGECLSKFTYSKLKSMVKHMDIYSINSPFCMSAQNISSYNLCILLIRKDLTLSHILENKEQLFLMNLRLSVLHCSSD